MAHKGKLEEIMKTAEARQGTAYQRLQGLVAVVREFVSTDEIAVVYPRIAPVDTDDELEEGVCLELILFAADGRILVASVLPADRFEMVVTDKTEICSLQISGLLSPSSREMMPALGINFKDGSRLDLNSSEDFNDYWGEEYPGIIKEIISLLR